MARRELGSVPLMSNVHDSMPAPNTGSEHARQTLPGRQQYEHNHYKESPTLRPPPLEAYPPKHAQTPHIQHTYRHTYSIESFSCVLPFRYISHLDSTTIHMILSSTFS